MIAATRRLANGTDGVYKRGYLILVKMLFPKRRYQPCKIQAAGYNREGQKPDPAVMCNRAVLVFTDAGHPDIFYDMWNAGLGTATSGTTRVRIRPTRSNTTSFLI
jgi:hypothetical protein